MSKVSRLAGSLHKWLALVMAVQILFWFISGLFFAIAPIERVRSEHMIAGQSVASLPVEEVAAGLRRISEAGAGAAEKIEIRSVLGRPVAVLSVHAARPRLYDLGSGRLISPIAAPLAKAIAEADHAGVSKAASTTFVQDASPEYRGGLPAWRVDFYDDTSRSLYVSVDTGVVGARRSTLWRTYDFLWALHIMDFKDHENFNTPWLIVATALSLIVVLSGIVLLPSRLGWARRNRSKRDRQQTP